MHAIAKLRETDPTEARKLEVALCEQALKEVEAMPAPSDLAGEARLELLKGTLRQVLAGEARVENVIVFDDEFPSILGVSSLVH